MDAVGLAPSAGVWPRVAVVEGEGVPSIARLRVGGPPTFARGLHRLGALAPGTKHEVDAFGLGGPDRVVVQHQPSRTSRATGRVASRSAAAVAPSKR